jgi:ATP-dependent Lhr-like helicase
MAFPEDFELYQGTGGGSTAGGLEALDRIFPDRSGRFGFWDLADSAKLTSAELSDRLWEAAWAGAVANDSFSVLRRGVQNRFTAVEMAREGGPAPGRRTTGRRPGFTRWQASRPAAGLWYRIDRPPGAEEGTEGVDLLGIEELNRDRVRQLVARYGVLFRELLENELPALRWPALFRTLRIMELSGELVTGRFFDGIMGPQFALPGIAAELPAKDHDGAAAEPTWWLNACDPASLCGVPVPGLKGSLPSRLPSNHVVFRGDVVVLVSRRGGRDLTFAVPSDDPGVTDTLVLFRAMVGRDVRAPAAVHVETINGVPATGSPYRSALLAGGFVEDYQRLSLRASA